MELILKFYYPMNLQYSKTQLLPTTLVRIVLLPCDSAPLQTLKEASKVATGAKCTQLHYSKTYSFSEIRVVLVLLPYEFTLLQNVPCKHHCHYWVLLSYEFTLLQNLKRGLKLLPVKIS